MICDRAFSALLEALSTPWAFLVTGAGVSVPHVPLSPRLISRWATKYHTLIGGYPVERRPMTPLRERLLAPVLPFHSPSPGRLHSAFPNLDPFLVGIPDAAVAAFFEWALYRPFLPVAPSNYGVFGLVLRPAIIFDFNLDGQMAVYAPRGHVVLSPHGTVDPEIIEHDHYGGFLRGAADYGLPMPVLRARHLPGPEPSTMTRRPEYRHALRLFPFCKVFVLIGYSFGSQPKGIDDAESFEFFVELLRRHRIPVVVADSNPEPIAGMLEDRIRRGNVYACDVFWDLFSSSACTVGEFDPWFLDLCGRHVEILSLYRRRLERER